MRIVFLGAGDIGLPTLCFLLDHPRHQLAAVVTQPDKPVGRSQALTPPQAKSLALQRGIPVLQPEKIRHCTQELVALQPDVFVVIAYGQILPQSVLDIPRAACLNLHASLLPRHRGASPIQAAILAGDIRTGMTVMHMNAGLDTGDILLAESIGISPDETGGSLHDKLAELGPRALAPALDLVEKNAAPRQPQDHAAATLTRKLTREDGLIDWSRPAEEIARKIRAFDPWPGTASKAAGKSLKLYPPVNVSPATGDPGRILPSPAGELLVACGAGAVSLRELQLEGKKRLPVREFLAGNALPERLG
jgi:methionyl-tRNA formyltransferase